MKRAIIIALDAALFASLAAGCATKPAPQPQIKPVLEVRHSGLQPDGYYQLGRFLQTQGRYEDAARPTARRSRSIRSMSTRTTASARLYALQGRYAEAHAEFEAALAAVAGQRRRPQQPRLYVPARAEAGRGGCAARESRTARAGKQPISRELRDRIQQPDARLRTHSVTAAPATFDAVTAPPQPVDSMASKTAPETESARLVAIGPHAFELVMPKPSASKPVLATLPTSHGRLAVEVSNGNGAAGMARRVGKQLRDCRDESGPADQPDSVRRGDDAGSTGRATNKAALDLSGAVPGHPPVVASIGLRKASTCVWCSAGNCRPTSRWFRSPSRWRRAQSHQIRHP